jgi:uncharacterized protein (DUF2384 family)
MARALPASVRAIRFFDATAQVTDSPGIGTLEAPAGLLVSSEARQVLVEVNTLLLDVNMQVIAQTHHMAIGKALVFSMHGRPQAEYTRHIQSGQREYQPVSTP